MAEGTYEYECMRAELLGVEKPNQEEFEEKMRLQRAAEEEKQLTEQMKEVDLRDEQLQGTGSKIEQLNRMFMTTQHRMAKFKEIDLHAEQLQGTGGKIDELNKMLSITQQRITKFKNVYGSLKSLIRSRPSTPSEGCSSNDPANGTESNTINDALDALDTMKDVENASDVTIAKSAAIDLEQKVTCQLDKLDSLLYKADNATYSMKNQTDQMKKIAK